MYELRQSFMGVWQKTAICVAVLSMCCLAACVRQTGGSAADAEIFRVGSISVEVSAAKDISPVIYVGVQDKNSHVGNVRQHLITLLQGKGFEVTDNPSQAGYILQVSVAAAGSVAPESVRTLMNAGYNAPVTFSGTGATALVADALLVLRRLPESKRPGRTYLENIANRNAVADHQMRVGVMARIVWKDTVALPDWYAEVLAKEVCAGLSPMQP